MPQTNPYAAVDTVGTLAWLQTHDVLRAMGTDSFRAVREGRASLIPFKR